MKAYIVSLGSGSDYFIKGVFTDEAKARKLYNALLKVSENYSIWEHPNEIEVHVIDETPDYCCKQFWSLSVWADSGEKFNPSAEIATGYETVREGVKYTTDTFEHFGRKVITIKCYESKEDLRKIILYKLWLNPTFEAAK